MLKKEFVDVVFFKYVVSKIIFKLQFFYHGDVTVLL